VAIAPSIRILRKQGKQGKAFSLIEGFAQARGEFIGMIDGDLQYPPQKFPEMFDALTDADVVIATRQDYKDSKLRKLLSRGFRNVFGKFLFGLSTDIQSGLKVFKREVYKTVKFNPVSPWTFDLEFLSRAKQAGYILKNVPITFAPRLNGESKMNVVKQSMEIGTNALSIKLKKAPHFPIHPEEGSMRGAGVGYKQKKYVTHTTLPLSLSAIQTFSLFQKIFFITTPLLVIASLIVFPLNTARWLVGFLSILYFIDAVFNIYVVSKSLNKQQEIDVTEEELQTLNESKLPIYTILCPLYKEAHVAPQFLEAIAKLDWPMEKLDVMFLLEENDKETIEAFEQMNLPFYARTVIVPDSQPKTKPKACNYGLTFAKGKYLVIFDAEDIPDPLQLKKAYLGFKKAPANVKCLQAKLSYYNSRHNLLTRFFTAEYALWFDITLPGLQSLNSALPLGGTSNHFEVKNLLELQGWDPFNVTEDADLGVRLFQHGYLTAIINSNTYEEATSVPKNWLRQRSRWIKGYMQTYLVHMRNIGGFIRSKGIIHNLIFQLNVGGKILFVLLNPFMWIITALYFLAYHYIGAIMQAVYTPPISYIAVVSWVFGNFMFLYCYMLAIAKRKQWDLAKYIFLIPIYWVMMSTAAMIALYQLILKPHYWEKTLHGFHLGRKETDETVSATQIAIRPIAALKPAYATIDRDISTDAKPLSFGFSLPKLVIPVLKVPELSVAYLQRAAFKLMRIMPNLLILNLDLLLARIFLPGSDAILYLVMSLFAKAIYLINHFSANVFAETWAFNKVAKNHFHKLVFLTFIFNWIAFTLFGLEGNYILPHLYNGMFAPIIPSVGFYIFALLCFGISNRFNNYYLNKKNYTFAVISVITLLMLIPLLAIHHDSIGVFSRTFAYLGSINLIFIMIVAFAKPYVRIVENNYASLMGLFDKIKSPKRVWKNNAMRILIFNWRDTKHVYAGGAEVYVHELAQRWVQNGNKVTIFCGNDNSSPTYEHLNGVEVYRRGGTYTVYFFAIAYYLTKFRGKYDVIIDCENGIPFFMPLFAREQVILLIHHVHQDIFRKFLRFPLNYVAEVLEGKVMPFIYQNKTVVTVSQSSQKNIFDLGFTRAENIEIIPNGVSDGLYVNYPKTDYPSFVYLGRLKEYKNIHVAIEAFSKVLRVHRNAKLSVVGTGEEYLKLVKLVNDLKIAHAVIFHGRVTEKEKAVLLSQSWAALQPSQMEGWGITVIEANAAGTPVIASNVHGLKDSVIDGQTGVLVPVGDVARFAIAMRKVVEDDMLRMNLTKEAILWAKNFNWDKSADAFYDLIGKNFGQSVSPTISDVVFSATDRSEV